jgi:hypothetical protein
MIDIALALLQIVVLGITIAAIAIQSVAQTIDQPTFSSSSLGLDQLGKYTMMTSTTFGFVLLLSIIVLIKNTESVFVFASLMTLGLAAWFGGLVAGKIPAFLNKADVTQNFQHKVGVMRIFQHERVLQKYSFFYIYSILLRLLMIFWFTGCICVFLEVPLQLLGFRVSDILFILTVLSFLTLTGHIYSLKENG